MRNFCKYLKYPLFPKLEYKQTPSTESPHFQNKCVLVFQDNGNHFPWLLNNFMH
uniref:Uncharacterized protein n=1 Tax=Anguilla anguilla TaxID=7936 RepID=A0A0E9QAJ1_ANGAN